MSWQDELKEEGRQLRRYTEEVEAKLRYAEKVLQDIGVGVIYPDAVSDPAWQFSTTKLQCTAAYGLRKLSSMPCRKKPISTRF